MKYSPSALFVLCLFNRAIASETNSLRGRPGRPLDECTVGMVSYLQIPGEPPISGGDSELGCDDGAGNFLPLSVDDEQRGSIMEMAQDGQIFFGLSKLNVDGLTVGTDGGVSMPPGQAISVLARENSGKPLFDRDLQENDASAEEQSHRSLQSGTGNKHFILFRVIDSQGAVYADDAVTMSSNVYSDAVNIKTQMTACSVGKYTVIPGGKPGYDTSPLEVSEGVIEITLPITLDNPRSTIHNAAIDAAEAKLAAHFGLSSGTSLTRYFDHTMFSLKECRQECGWAAYAGVGSYYQFYQARYYRDALVQLHEHGHNMQLAHSGGLDGQTYTDHTCSMGNPLYGDDLGRMCFNPAKNWQMQFNPHPTTVISGWYDSSDFKTVNTSQGAETHKMIGIGEYALQSEPRKAVVLQVANGTTRPQYVAFNSAKGANAQNDEADNLVTIVEYSGTGYAVSSLKGYIGQGSSFTTTEGRIVTAQCINTSVTPSIACVCVRDAAQTCPGGCSCESDSPAPTNAPTPQPTNAPVDPTMPPTPSPTPVPTDAPTASPTSSAMPTKTPTPEPSAAPTNEPTPSPTFAPVTKYICKKTAPSDSEICATNNFLGDSTCPTAGASCGNGGKICNVATCPSSGPPPPTPPPAPTPTPPTGGCSASNCGACDGRGVCRDAGCSWSRGSCS